MNQNPKGLWEYFCWFFWESDTGFLLWIVLTGIAAFVVPYWLYLLAH